jgi:soluble lytic murein transglycosylase
MSRWDRYPHGMMMRSLVLFTSSLFVFLTTSTAFAATDTYAEVRRQFQRAYAMAGVAAPGPQPEDSTALREYPLYPYLQAARIRQALTKAGPELGAADERAQAFLTEHGSAPVVRDLRRAWLASLAKRRLWEKYLEHYDPRRADDSQHCHSYAARIALGRTEGLAADVRAKYLTPKSIPDCQRAFDWLRAQGELSPELLESRVRRALEQNNFRFARELAVRLPEERAAPLRLWAALLESPLAQIDALIANPSRPVEREALLAGWTRLSRTNRDAAMERFERLVRQRKLSAEEASPFALALALPLSWDRRPQTLSYFERAHPEDFDDVSREWRVRAAIWANDWALVSRAIAAMPDEQRKLARWRYWAGRAAAQLDRPELARELYESLLADDNFYSLMAAARLGRPVLPNVETIATDPTQLAEVGQLPEFVRARELLLSNLRGFANGEWSAGVERLATEMRKQAIHLAASWGWYDQAIATATQQRVFNDYPLLYPRPFDREVERAAQLSNLPPELIYGVMRQESLYRADAVSSAGARGLLQMLPETARRTAATWKRPAPSLSDLFVPSTNISLGAAHLRTLIDQFNGQIVVALASYNAGPGAARRWLPSGSIEPDIWIENIPYNETRGYVQRILWHTVVFNWLKSGEPQNTERWLARVGRPEPQDAVSQVARED